MDGTPNKGREGESVSKEDRLLHSFGKYKIYRCLACDFQEETGVPCGRIELHDNEGWLADMSNEPYIDLVKEILRLNEKS